MPKATRIETPAQMFSREFCEIFSNSILIEFLHSSKLMALESDSHFPKRLVLFASMKAL